MKEIELRIKISDQELTVKKLVQKLLKNGYTEIKDYHQVDTYYKRKGLEDEQDIVGSFIYRIREQNRHGENVVLATRKQTIKEGIWKENEILLFDSHDQKSVEFIKRIFEDGYSLIMIIDKERKELKKKNITLNIDKIIDLGLFIEAEILTEVENPSDEILEKLREELGSFDSQIISKGYVQLMREKNDNINS